MELDNLEAKINTRLALIPFGRKTVELLKSGIRKNNIKSKDQKEIQPLENNHNNTKSGLILISDLIDSPPR